MMFKAIEWFRSRSRPVRYFLIGFFVPLLWTFTLGGAGQILGTGGDDSPGSILVGVALLAHLPAGIVFGQLFSNFGMSPGGDGVEGAFMFALLIYIFLPSCLFYGLSGWLLGKGMDMKGRI